jgi:hypothetical protein
MAMLANALLRKDLLRGYQQCPWVDLPVTIALDGLETHELQIGIAIG